MRFTPAAQNLLFPHSQLGLGLFQGKMLKLGP
jgi:hypothetical protein